MAAAMRKKQARRGRKQGRTGQLLMAGMSVLIVGLLAFSTVQFLGLGQGAGAAAIHLNSNSVSAVEIDSDSREAGTNVRISAAERERTFLGPPTNPAGLSLVEAGQAGQPSLVWFHADWCHVCQEIKPEVIDLGEAYEGQVEFIRLNVDDRESREALRRYGIRATPTFVLFDPAGQMRANVRGWPGVQALKDAFGQLLAE